MFQKNGEKIFTKICKNEIIKKILRGKVSLWNQLIANINLI
jgi:hypothetical protein